MRWIRNSRKRTESPSTAARQFGGRPVAPGGPSAPPPRDGPRSGICVDQLANREAVGSLLG